MKKRAFTKTKILALIIILLIAAAATHLLTKPKKIKNVLLITLDTTRADHMSCYGFPKNTTPNIDAIAAEGILFENAVSPIPLTLPAHSSIFTGTYPPYHKVHDNLNYRLDETNITLAEILKEKGFTTAAIISAFVLYPQFGIAQGFESFNNKFEKAIDARTDIERKGDETSRLACQFLEKNKDKPFFLFLHYFDPHTKYDPPEPFASQYPDDLYSGEIAFTDYCIKQVIQKLKNLDLYDSTMIIIVGDHGEGLGEHNESEHSYYIYQSTLKVPLIMRIPTVKAAKKIENVVSVVDILPTILAYFDIDIPTHVQGRDLSILINTDQKDLKYQYVFAESLMPTKYECNPLFALIGKKWKYIDTTRPELYDLINDHGELNNLAKKENKRAKMMQGQLRQLMSEIVGGIANGKLELDEQSRKRLESLGYVGGDIVDDVFEFDKNKKDPKDMIDYSEALQKTTLLIYQKNYDRAFDLCHEMLEKWPEVAATYFTLLRISHTANRMEKVLEYGNKYLSRMEGKVDLTQEASGLSPTKNLAKTREMMGEAAYKLKKIDLAIKHWQQALKIKPRWPEMYNNMGIAYFNKNDWDKAVLYWNEAIKLRPDWNEIKKYIDLAKKSKKQQQLIQQYEKTVELKPDDIETHIKLGQIYYKNNDWKNAEKHWTEVVNLDQNRYQIFNNLAWILAADKDGKVYDPKKAIQFAKQACELTKYERPDMLDTLGVAYAADGKFDDAIKTAEKALKIAIQKKQEDIAQEIRNHLELYHANKPYNK